MTEIYELSGQALDDLRRVLGLPDIRTLTVTIDGGLKYKLNDHVWNPPVGERVGIAPDPVSDTVKKTAQNTARALDILANDLHSRASDLRDLADTVS